MLVCQRAGAVVTAEMEPGQLGVSVVLAAHSQHGQVGENG